MRKAPSCEEKGRQPPPLGARPRVGEPLRFEELQEALARRALVPVGVAGDDLEQGIGGGVAVAGGGLRSGKLEPRLMIVGIGGELRLDRPRVDRRNGRKFERRAGPGDRRLAGAFGR